MKEEKLLERILSGDQAAFTELVERYWDTVFRSTLSILHDPKEAEEITSDVFFKVHTHLSQLKEKTFFSSWLKKISFNMAIDRLRKKTGVSCIPLSEVDPSEIASPPADEELLRREIVDEILLALNELSDSESDILSEHLLEGKEYSKLSKEYGLSYHAVVMRIRRAKEKVKKKVLKRLGGIIILPWEKIAKILGGATVKLTTKIAITTTALVMLAGVGVFLTHKEEKTAAKGSDVKVERQLKERAPASVSVSKPEPKEEQKVEQYSDEEIKEALAWLDSLEEENSTELEEVEVEEETVSESQTISEPQEERFFGLTREEIKAEVPVLEERIRTNLTRAVSLYKDLRSTDGMRTSDGESIPGLAECRKETWEDIKRLWEETFVDTCRYIKYSLVIDADDFRANSPLAKGGWIYELYKPLPMRIGSEVIPTAQN